MLLNHLSPSSHFIPLITFHIYELWLLLSAVPQICQELEYFESSSVALILYLLGMDHRSRSVLHAQNCEIENVLAGSTDLDG